MHASRMTEQDAQIVLLRQELDQAASTISFLHSCLTDDRYRYAYPDQTERRLELIRKLAPRRALCVHSRFHADCENCQGHRAWMTQRAEALSVLGLDHELNPVNVDA